MPPPPAIRGPPPNIDNAGGGILRGGCRQDGAQSPEVGVLQAGRGDGERGADGSETG